MTAPDLLRSVVGALEAAGIPFMLTGSLAVAVHGAARAIMDLDLVIDATAEQLQVLVAALSGSGLYVSAEAALEALHHESMFNVVDAATGWKADLIVRKSRPFSRTEFGRRRPSELRGRSQEAVEEYFETQGTLDRVRAFRVAGGTILFGTDAGFYPPSNPTPEYRLLARAGLSHHEILRALATGPASYFGEGEGRERVATGACGGSRPAASRSRNRRIGVRRGRPRHAGGPGDPRCAELSGAWRSRSGAAPSGATQPGESCHIAGGKYALNSGHRNRVGTALRRVTPCRGRARRRRGPSNGASPARRVDVNGVLSSAGSAGALGGTRARSR